jgi:hypothetical protein
MNLKKIESRLLVLLILIFPFVSCDDSAQTSGPTTYVIGQPLTVSLEKGESLIENKFKLTDSNGVVFDPSNPLLQYVWLGKNKFSFRIPPGIAAGKAKVEVESEGSPYSYDVNIIRGIVYSDTDGYLNLVSLDNPEKMYRTSLIGTGELVVRVVNDESEIVVMSKNVGRIDWFSIDSVDNSIFGIKVPSLSLGSGTTGFNAVPQDTIALPRGLLIATDSGIAGIGIEESGSGGSEIVFDSWLINEGDFKALDVSGPIETVDGTNNKRIVSVGTTTDGSLILYKVDTIYSEWLPDNRTDNATTYFLMDASGISDVTISRNGENAVVVSEESDSFFLIDLEVVRTGIITGFTTSLFEPASCGNCDCKIPIAVSFIDDDTKIAVLCNGSNSVAIYRIQGTTANHEANVTVGSDANPPVSMFVTSDNMAYISLQNGGIISFNSASSNISPSFIYGTEDIATSSFIIQP